MREKNIKICLASSSGGHFEQLMMLKPLIEKYSGYIVTEKIGYDVKVGDIPVKYVLPINRTDKTFVLPSQPLLFVRNLAKGPLT